MLNGRRGPALQSQQPHSLRQLACHFEASPFESSCQGLSPRRGAVPLSLHPQLRDAQALTRTPRLRGSESARVANGPTVSTDQQLCSPSPRLSAGQAGQRTASPPKTAFSTRSTNVTLSSLRRVCPADAPRSQHLTSAWTAARSPSEVLGPVYSSQCR